MCDRAQASMARDRPANPAGGNDPASRRVVDGMTAIEPPP